MFTQQKARSQQLLNSLQWKPLAPSYLLSALQGELANLDSIYTSYKLLVLTVTQLLKREPFNGMSSFSKCVKRSLLPFLGDTLSWLTGIAMTTNAKDIKKRVNQLIKMQKQQQETLEHVISTLNITRYPTQVNRQHINTVMEVVGRTHDDITTLFNITSSIYSHINYQQILLHIHSILANLRDSLYYKADSHACIGLHRHSNHQCIITPCISSRRFMRNADTQWSRVTTNHALTSIIRWHPSLYRYLHIHILVAEEQFLLLIEVPIPNHAQKLDIYKVFNLLIPKGTCQHTTTQILDIWEYLMMELQQ